MLFCLSSCIFVPFISAYKELGNSPADRKKLFSKSQKDFNTSLLNVSKMQLQSFFIDPKDAYYYFKKNLKNQKVFKIENEYLDFDDEAKLITAYVNVKYFKVPVYIVNDRTEVQVWSFEKKLGWKIKEIKDE